MVSSSSGVDGGPVVSILMTTFNRDRYIGDAIESVLASTFTDFELIIVDDGSRDRTVEIAQGYAKRDRRVTVYINEKNLGDYPNRNKAASYATGKYLKYVDSDDYIYPWGIELLVRMMEKFPEAGWGLCSLPQVKERPYPFQLGPKEAYEHHYFGPGLFHKAPLSAILVRSAFEKLGGFSGMRMGGDSEMWHRMAMHYPVVLMPEGMVWYREHGEQEMKSYREFQHVYERIKAAYLLDRDCPLDPEPVKKIVSAAKRAFRRQIIKGMITVNSGLIKENLNYLRLYKHA